MTHQITTNLSLFPEPAKVQHAKGVEAALVPLAERMRPREWSDFSLDFSLDSKLIERLKAGQGRVPSLILWGPPGSGKTTLAKLIGASYKANFIELSSVMSGVKEIRELTLQAKQSKQATILFIDEIHRFNKGQQDAFLPHVEAGTISLIGATTENPSFYLTQALLSRCKVLTLPSHSEQVLTEILRRAALSLSLTLELRAGKALIDFSSGDARRMLNVLEEIYEYSKRENLEGGISGQITYDYVIKFLSNKRTKFYDRDGEEHYNIVSAFIKSLRGSDPDAALYWGFRMLEGGEDPRFLIRRMIIFASEDIGNADPQALLLAVATLHGFEQIGLPEGKIPIAQCITYLARAKKSNKSYVAMKKALKAIEEFPSAAVPLHLRNAPTELMKELGYGAGYKYSHDFEGQQAIQDYLPAELKDQKFYQE